MACDPWIEALSAMADGEDPGIAPKLVERHVKTCASCRAFEADLAATRPAMRLTEAEPVPDVSARVAKANAVADRSSRWVLIRVMLGLVAAQIVVLSTPILIFGDSSGGSPHGGRHLGAFSLAYAVGLVAVFLRPARARTMLPVAQVLCAAIALSTIVDVLDGSVGASNEVVHLPEAISLVLVWTLAVPSSSTRSARIGARLRAAFRRDRNAA